MRRSLLALLAIAAIAAPSCARVDAGNASGLQFAKRVVTTGLADRSSWCGAPTTTCGSRSGPPGASPECSRRMDPRRLRSRSAIFVGRPDESARDGARPGLLKSRGTTVYVAYAPTPTPDQRRSGSDENRASHAIRACSAPPGTSCSTCQPGTITKAGVIIGPDQAVFHDRRRGNQPARQLLQPESRPKPADR